MKTDIQIAQSAEMLPIRRIGAVLNIAEDDMEPYGKYKAKLNLSEIRKKPRKGKLILVTAISPTPAGEGKTTTSVGLADALHQLDKNVVLALREPSLGPVFGIKGGAAGGGYAQVVPMEDINLHFTGVDMNDRQLRNIVCGLGGRMQGVPREEGFDITVASEVMAALCLASDLMDLKQRLSDIIVGYNYSGEPVTAGDLKAAGAMTALLKDAIKPNLVQTLEHTPALIHGGPFANIAHGCNSVSATDAALRLGDYVVTEAGFGADLGAEKFLDIKCRAAGLTPDAVVIVATVRALKYHGGVPKAELTRENLPALEKGLPNLLRHVENITQVYGLPAVVAINQFDCDTEAEIDLIRTACAKYGVKVALSQVWGKGGKGGLELAEEVLNVMETGENRFTMAYPDELPLADKITAVAQKVYHADGVHFLPAAKKELERLEELGFGSFPVCMAKTQYSFSDDPALLGAPEGFTITVRKVKVCAGARFVVTLTGDIMTMPGLPKVPAAERIDVDEDGVISGLF